MGDVPQLSRRIRWLSRLPGPSRPGTPACGAAIPVGAIGMAADDPKVCRVPEKRVGGSFPPALTDTVLRDRLGSIGRKTAEKYSWNRISNDFLDVCLSISGKERINESRPSC